MRKANLSLIFSMNFENQSIRTKLLIIFFLFLLLRIIYCYFLGWQEIPSGSDAISYNGYALAILNQPDWLSNPSFLGDYRPPGYPLFLALIYSIFGVKNLLAVYIFQAVIGTLTVYYIFRLSSSIFGEGKSFLALFWAGFYFFYLWYTGMILRETLVFFLIIFSFCHLWLFFQSERPSHLFRSGNLWAFIIGFTFLFHTDPRYLFYIPFLAILFVIYCNFWTGVKTYSWVLAMLILLLVPWTIRNYIAYDGFVLINTRTLDARQKNVSMRTKQLRTAMITETENKDYPSEQERTLIKRGQNPNNRTLEEIEIIKKDIYPASTFFQRKLYWLVELWRPARFTADYFPFPGARFQKTWSFRHNVSGILCYGTLLPFMFVGIYFLIKERNNVWVFLTFPIVVNTLLHILQWGRERYRIPIDAFIIILACYGMVVAYEFVRTRHG